MLMAASGEFSQAPSMDFTHSDRGVICITAGHGSGVISFDPDYDHHAPHTLKGFRSVVPREPLSEDLQTYNYNCGASTIPAIFLIPITEILNVLEFILERHDYAPFVEWQPGA